MGRPFQNIRLCVDYPTRTWSVEIHLEIPLDEDQGQEVRPLLEARDRDALIDMLTPLVIPECQEMVREALSTIDIERPE